MAGKRTTRRIDRRVWLALLILVGAVVWSKDLGVGGLGWSDAPLHAMDGVLIHDLIKDMPDQPLSQWVMHYYGKFPCLGLIVYYPPFFAVIEAAMFLIFGISAAVARLTVVFFALGALVAIYWAARQLLDRDAAIFAAAVWASMPSTVLWSRQVMLEIPTVAMIALCCGLYLKFRSTKHVGWLWACGAAFVLAALTKQTAIFIAPVIVIDMLITVGWKKSVKGGNLIIGAVAGGIVLGYLLFAARYARLSSVLVWDESWFDLLGIRNWTYYPAALPKILGWPGLAFAVIALALVIVGSKTKHIRLPIVWAGIFYLFASIIAYKEPRYFYFITPVAAVVIAAGFSLAVKGTHLKRSCHALLCLLICWQFLAGWHAKCDRPADYRAAADLVHAGNPTGETELVLVDAVRDGQFVFDLRQAQGHDGKCYVLRGSKVLYSRAARVRWYYSEYVKTHADVLKLIDTYGIRYIIVESGPPDVDDWQAYFPPPSTLLRQVLSDAKRFEKIAGYPISNDHVSPWKNVRLEVYRNHRPTRRKTDHLTIPVPAAGKTLQIPLAN